MLMYAMSQYLLSSSFCPCGGNPRLVIELIEHGCIDAKIILAFPDLDFNLLFQLKNYDFENNKLEPKLVMLNK